MIASYLRRGERVRRGTWLSVAEVIDRTRLAVKQRALKLRRSRGW
ncbi:hypothetical protein [Candidatus Palauibacter sp.]